jgi:ribose transport system substrate-binding protein
MKRRQKGGLLAVLALAVCALLAVGCGSSDDDGGGTGTGASADEQFTIGFVTADVSDEFWSRTLEGARQADEELPEVEVIGQDAGPDLEEMISVGENMLTRNVDAIVVTAIPEMQNFIKRAGAQGVPVISYANDLPDLDEIKGTVSTENYAAGEKAGAYIKEQLGGRGKIALLDIARGTYVTLDERVEGLQRALEGSGIEVVAHLDTGCDVSRSVSVMQNVLTKDPDLNAVFGACSQAILGAQQALKQAGKSPRDVVTIGYDAKEPELKAIAAGTQDATVAQFPRTMGYESIKAALKVLQGEQVEDYLDTGSELVTRENAQRYLNDPNR